MRTWIKLFMAMLSPEDWSPAQTEIMRLSSLTPFLFLTQSRAARSLMVPSLHWLILDKVCGFPACIRSSPRPPSTKLQSNAQGGKYHGKLQSEPNVVERGGSSSLRPDA